MNWAASDRASIGQAQAVSSFLILFSDPDGVRYKEKAVIWSMMAYHNLPWWKWLLSEQAVTSKVITGMFQIARDQGEAF